MLRGGRGENLSLSAQLAAATTAAAAAKKMSKNSCKYVEAQKMTLKHVVHF